MTRWEDRWRKARWEGLTESELLSIRGQFVAIHPMDHEVWLLFAYIDLLEAKLEDLEGDVRDADRKAAATE